MTQYPDDIIAAPPECIHCIDERDCANAPICAAVAALYAPKSEDRFRQEKTTTKEEE